MVPLDEHFNDPDTSGVRLTTLLGKIDLALYDQRTPITVANFKSTVISATIFWSIRLMTIWLHSFFIARFRTL